MTDELESKLIISTSEKELIEAYWTKRTENFAQLRIAELQNEKSSRWLTEINSQIPKGKTLKILDIGTGCGFFTILLAALGHDVIGIDLTHSMIEKSFEIASQFDISAQFQVMDAENLDFGDNSFDMVVSRNLTWTLPNPLKAYSEWVRVLRKGGILLNFDGAYGYEAINSKYPAKLPSKHVHNQISPELTDVCDKIYRMLDISYLMRPQWDKEILLELGCSECCTDDELSNRIYKEVDELYNPTPMFMIRAVK